MDIDTVVVQRIAQLPTMSQPSSPRSQSQAQWWSTSTDTTSCSPEASEYIGLERLLESGSFSDVTLFVGPTKKKFRVHKGILSQNSGYFDRIFQAEGFREARDNEVYLPEHEWNVLEKVLLWLYTGSLFKQKGWQKPYFIDICAKIYTYATYFDVPSLKKPAVDLCISCLDEERYHFGREYHERFVEAAKILFETCSTVEGLQVEAFISAISAKHFLPTVLAAPELQEMVFDEPSLMLKMLEAKAGACECCRAVNAKAP